MMPRDLAFDCRAFTEDGERGPGAVGESDPADEEGSEMVGSADIDCTCACVKAGESTPK